MRQNPASSQEVLPSRSSTPPSATKQGTSSTANEATPQQDNPHLAPVSHRWLLLSLGVLVLFLLIWAVPQWQVAPLNLEPRDRLVTENEIRDTWAKILAALFFLVAAYFTWRYIEAVGKTVAAAERTVAAAEKSSAIAQERQITERFVRVMELLGDDKLEVRLGGIYALERIARDSPQDQNAVTEVLATYVREHSPWQEADAQPQRLRADVQAIMTVLARRTWNESEEQSLDLHGTALATAYLPFARLQRAYLYETNLRGAMLYRANLRGAWLWKAHLHNAILEGAYLEGTDLTAAEGLTWEQLEQASYDKTTKLPDYLRATAPDAYEQNAARTAPRSEVEEEQDELTQADAELLPSKTEVLPTKIDE